MPAEAALLVLRIVVIGALYTFLFLVVLVVARDLRRGGREATVEAVADIPAGHLAVVSVDPEVTLGADTFALAPESTIGRDASATVTIPDSFVSTRHARLSHRRGRWWIEDLGSTNGTRVNGRPVKGAVAVAFGDTLDVGRVRFRLERN
jgi:hypothetical protein